MLGLRRRLARWQEVISHLRVLVENAGHVVGKDDLLSIVWPDEVVEEGNLAVYISALRKALGDNAGRTAYIETIPKRGYRFAAPVSRLPSVAVLPFEKPESRFRE